jgi:hypothetical protein
VGCGTRSRGRIDSCACRPPPNGVGLNIIKRFPAEAYTLAVLQNVIHEVRKWTRVEDIAAIHIELNFVGWLEIADPPKWDPRNRETADHSLPYEIARALVDGEIWIDSFNPDKLMDPAVRGLMEKITASVNPDYSYHGQVRMTVRTKADAQLVRELGRNNTGISLGTPVTHGSWPVRPRVPFMRSRRRATGLER